MKDVKDSFEWHDKKACKNVNKHGISFEEAVSVFSDPLSLSSLDEFHSYDEDRWIIIGCSKFNKLLIISYTERSDKIRIISARKANSAERKRYEKK